MTTPDSSSERPPPPAGIVARLARAGGTLLGAVQGLGVALFRSVRSIWRWGEAAGAERRRVQRRAQDTLPSLYERYPNARQATRRTRGLAVVPLEEIVGTERHPSQNTADFLPLPQLRGRNWAARWQRINGAMDRLAVLPPVSLLKIGNEYYVSDGHNRVAAALRAGAVGIDAEVTELILPGTEAEPAPENVGSTLASSGLLRDAGSGRLSRTAAPVDVSDQLDRSEILHASGPDAHPPAEHAEPKE